jgi:hypothetical protein
VDPPLDFLTTPSTPLKRIWPKPQGHPPPLLDFQLLCIYDNFWNWVSRVEKLDWSPLLKPPGLACLIRTKEVWFHRWTQGGGRGWRRGGGTPLCTPKKDFEKFGYKNEIEHKNLSPWIFKQPQVSPQKNLKMIYAWFVRKKSKTSKTSYYLTYHQFCEERLENQKMSLFHRCTQ